MVGRKACGDCSSVCAPAGLAHRLWGGQRRGNWVRQDTRPVITPAEPWEGSPLAEVEGHLALQEGCLLLDSEIVFWPHGTTWDDASRAVVFEDASPAQVGAQFAGGGGHYSGGTDFTSLLGQESGDAIDECKNKTDASGVVFAYP